MEAEFWQTKTLDEMTPAEWEALCDRCGQCCLIKLEDEETGELAYTNVACHLFDSERCTCRDYQRRQTKVKSCLVLGLSEESLFTILPWSCAYRTLYEKRELPDWHPLRSGQRESVEQAGFSVRGKVVSEEFIHPEQLTEHVVYWVALAAPEANAGD